MIWLAWRQFRKQALFTGIGLAVLAALMIPTGLAMHHSFDDLGLPECIRALGSGELVSASSEIVPVQSISSAMSSDLFC